MISTVVKEKELLNKAIDTGPRGELRWIDKNEIEVDRKYQRSQGSPDVKRIANNFQWSNFGTLVVARRKGGKLFCIDGMHRLLASRLISSVKTVPCYVQPDMDQQKEAASFEAINDNRNKLTPYDSFHAKLAAKNVEAISIQSILRRYGIQPGRTATAAFVNPGVWIFKLYRRARLEYSIKFIFETWGEDPRRNTRTVIDASATFLFDVIKKQLQDVTDAQIIACFKKVSLQRLHQLANDYASKRNRHDSYVQAMVDHWNHGRSVNKLHNFF